MDTARCGDLVETGRWVTMGRVRAGVVAEPPDEPRRLVAAHADSGLAELLRFWRVRAGLSQRRLAEGVDCHRSTPADRAARSRLVLAPVASRRRTSPAALAWNSTRLRLGGTGDA